MLTFINIIEIIFKNIYVVGSMNLNIIFQTATLHLEQFYCKTYNPILMQMQIIQIKFNINTNGIINTL